MKGFKGRGLRTDELAYDYVIATLQMYRVYQNEMCRPYHFEMYRL